MKKISTKRRLSIMLYKTVKSKGFVGVCKYLISKGATLDKVGQGYHMLHAAQEGKLEVVRFLFENDFDINIVDILGETPIFKSINSKCFAVTKFLYENGANLLATNKFGQSVEILLKNCDHYLLQAFFSSNNYNKRNSNNNEKELMLTNETSKTIIVKKLNPGIKAKILNQFNVQSTKKSKGLQT